MAAASMIVLWQTLLNMYDIIRSGTVNNITAVTSLVAFSALFIMRPVYAMCNLAFNYLLFVLLLWQKGDSGDIINFTITILLCVTIYFVRYWHLCIELRQNQEIKNIHQELEETRHQFRLTQDQYELIREHEKFITFEWDICNRWIRMSKGWEELFGQPSFIQNFEEFIKNQQALTDQQRRELLQCMDNARSGVERQKLELQLPLKNGEKRWFELLVISQIDQAGEAAFTVGMLRDIVDRKTYISRLEQEIQMDTFTGAFNKAAIETYGQRKVQELKSNERLVMFILDMDNFKDINDTYGHPCGDTVLKSVADLLRTFSPLGARIGRIGGDEFVVLFIVPDGTMNVRRYAEDIVRRMPALKCGDVCVGASCSLGIAVAQSGWSYAKLYETADKALYQAKKAGKNCVFEQE